MSQPAVSSPARIEANRLNAQKCTGPRDTSRTSLNALKHGIFSKHLLIPGESQEDLDEFREVLREDLRPCGPMEEMLFDTIFACAWRTQRLAAHEQRLATKRAELCVESGEGSQGPSGASEQSDATLFELEEEGAKLRRYEGELSRSMYRALGELRRSQGARRQELLAKERTRTQYLKQRAAAWDAELAAVLAAPLPRLSPRDEAARSKPRAPERQASHAPRPEPQAKAAVQPQAAVGGQAKSTERMPAAGILDDMRDVARRVAYGERSSDVPAAMTEQGTVGSRQGAEPPRIRTFEP